MNAAGIAGLALSLVMVPGSTPLMRWAAGAVVWMVALNLVFSRKSFRMRSRPIGRKDRMIILFVVALVVFNIALAWLVTL